MAVQQNKKSPSRRGMRRSHDSLNPETLSVDPYTGETHRRHHVTPDGFYRGKQVLETLCHIYYEKWNLPVKVVRPFNFYGPYMGINDKSFY